MKLEQIWISREAWQTLSSLKKPPRVAYRLMKYKQKYDQEVEACDKQRERYVYEAAGEEGGSVALKPETPEFNEFLSKFYEFLQEECELEPCGIYMDQLIDALDAETGNVLSESDLAKLEPFFENPESSQRAVS